MKAGSMDRIRSSKRGQVQKQGWTDQALPSASALPLPLLVIFAIVIFLLSISQYALYKERMYYMVINFKILFFLALILMISLLSSGLLRGEGWLGFWASSKDGWMRRELGRGLSGFPWGVALLVAVLVVLVSYQSSFQSKWFPLARAD